MIMKMRVCCFFLLIFLLMKWASLATARPLTRVQANMETEKLEGMMMMREGIGSMPPNCENKCGGCEPCMAIQVPTTTTSVDKMRRMMRPHYANYEPEGWKCKCGSTFYNP